MPTYTFLNTDTQEEFDIFLSMDGLDVYKKENPNLQHVIGAPAIGDPVRLGVRTIDNGFREVLSKIHNSQPKSNLAGKLSRR
jgi:hypothetical protein